MTLALDLLADSYEWHGAPCIGRSAEWATDNLSPDRLVRRAQGKELCGRCPHVRMCAVRALAEQMTGMVCAGVPIPGRARNRSESAWARHKLERLAAGEPLPLVLEEARR